jgi:4'-phosphopantetheinyl transferase
VDDVLVGWATATTTDEALGLLNHAERQRFEALRRPDDRSRFAAAHALLRWLVADDVGVTAADVDVVQHCGRCGRAHGQPRVLVHGRPGPAVSMAHAAGIVIAARAAHPIGIDLEPVGRVALTVASVILSPREQSALEVIAPSDRSTALTRTWVRKEALLKAATTGLLTDPRNVVLGSPFEAPRVEAWARPGPWSMADLSITAGYEAAVAVRAAKMPAITVRRIDAPALS